MLLLMGKVGEAILINEAVKITIASIKKDQADLLITAPNTISLVKSEEPKSEQKLKPKFSINVGFELPSIYQYQGGVKMLVVTRKKEEGIYIGKKIYLKILNIKKNQIRIAIEAPSHISIQREEIRNKNKKTVNE